jgi:lipoyl(octanoyl) transferase
LRIRDLGRLEYADCWQLQKQLLGARQRDEIPDQLLLVEHPEVITLGRTAGAAGNVLAPGDIPIFEIERGGDATYHGPGQLVGYPVLKLEAEERDLHRYLRDLEETIIQTLAVYGIAGERNPGWTGVWARGLNGELVKLASIGVAVKKWVTMHGFALNVTTQLDRFSAINPCGLSPQVMGSMASVSKNPPYMSDVISKISICFCRVFYRTVARDALELIK